MGSGGGVKVLARRIAKRIEFSGSAILVYEDDTFPAVVSSVSLGGMAIQTRRSLKVGKRVEVTSVTITECMPLLAEATVVWAEGRAGQMCSYGLQFDHHTVEWDGIAPIMRQAYESSLAPGEKRRK